MIRILAFLLALLGVATAQTIYNSSGASFSPPAITCTNQFIRSIAAATGVGTCASVASTDITGTLTNAQLPTRTSLQASPANQSTVAGTQTMVGAGGTCAITPATSTRLFVIFSGIFNNGTVSQSVTMQLRFGTGTAPVTGAAVTGTTVGNALVVTDLVASANEQFVLPAVITGLAAGTAVWIDFSGSAPAGTTSWSSMSCSAMEF